MMRVLTLFVITGNGYDAFAMQPMVWPMSSLASQAAVHNREATRTVAKAPLIAKTLIAHRLHLYQQQPNVAIRKHLVRRQYVFTKA